MGLPEIEPGQTTIGWIGTGVMGAPMCANLLRAGYALTVNDLDPASSQDLLAQGAQWVENPADLAESCDVVVSIVSAPKDVRQLILGPDGILARCQVGQMIVDLTSSEPALAEEIFARGKAQGVFCVDAPVTGGPKGAQDGELSIMIGGEPEAVQALEPLWRTMGKSWVHMGPAGSGQHAKLVNQILIANNLMGVAEAFLYAQKSGLDLQKVFDAVSGGAAASWQLSTHGPRNIQNNFQPGFMASHLIKDMGIVLAEADRLKIALPGLALVNQMYQGLKAQGRDNLATNALLLVLAAYSGLDWQERDNE